MTDPPGWFVDGLRALPPARFRAFVADLWRARGRELRGDGRVFVAADAHERRLLPLAAGEHGPVPSGVDVVVSVDPVEPPTARHVDVVGPEDLYELYRFAIDETAADRVRRRYLEPAWAAGPGDPGAGEESQPMPTVDQNPQPVRRQVLVAAAAFVAGIASIAAFGLAGPDDAGESAPNRNGSTPAGPLAVRPLPPGVSTDGVTDVRRLVDAHTARLANSSYTMTARRTVHGTGGILRSTLGVQIDLGEDRTLLADLATGGPSGRLLFGQRPATAQLWSPGDRLFRRLTADDETAYDEFVVGSEVGGAFYWANVFPFGGRWQSTAEFLRWVLGGTELSVAAADERPDGPVIVFALDGELPAAPVGPPDRSTVGLESLAASITNAGLVRSLRLGLGDRSASEHRQVTWSIEYRRLGETTANRPAWVDRFLIDEVLI